MQVIYFPPRKSYNFLKKVTIHSQFVNIFLVIMLSLHNLFFLPNRPLRQNWEGVELQYLENIQCCHCNNLNYNTISLRDYNMIQLAVLELNLQKKWGGVCVFNLLVSYSPVHHRYWDRFSPLWYWYNMARRDRFSQLVPLLLPLTISPSCPPSLPSAPDARKSAKTFSNSH